MKMLGSGVSGVYPLKAASKGLNPANTEVFWSCYSDYCPDFIRINSSNLSLSVDGDSTTGRPASGVYVLNIRSEDTVADIVVLEAFLIVIRYTSRGPAKRINITRPWDIWVQSGRSPYNVGRQPEGGPGRRRRSKEEVEAELESRGIGEDDMREILSWTDE